LQTTDVLDKLNTYVQIEQVFVSRHTAGVSNSFSLRAISALRLPSKGQL